MIGKRSLPAGWIISLRICSLIVSIDSAQTELHALLKLTDKITSCIEDVCNIVLVDFWKKAFGTIDLLFTYHNWSRIASESLENTDNYRQRRTEKRTQNTLVESHLGQYWVPLLSMLFIIILLTYNLCASLCISM